MNFFSLIIGDHFPEHYNNGPERVPAPDFDGNKTQPLPVLTPPEVEIETYFGWNGNSINPKIAGRLLTPDEGCGYSAFANMGRVVGGVPAKNGTLKLKFI